MNSSEGVKQRASVLRHELNDHSYRYYVLDAPVISDAQYDKLLRELQDIEAQLLLSSKRRE